MSQAQLENKVAAYLRDSLTLENYGRPISAEQLQAEMDRMARNTKQPEALRELFKALGNDPGIIAECLARPILAAFGRQFFGARANSVRWILADRRPAYHVDGNNVRASCVHSSRHC